MRINYLIHLLVKKIVSDMSDSQIKLMQNWLNALSNALFAFRSEAKREPLSFIEKYQKDAFETVDKNVSFCSTFSDRKLRIFRLSIDIARKSGEDFIEDTKTFSLRANEKQAERLLRGTGGKHRRVPGAFTNENTPNRSSFGIEIVDFKDS